MHHLDDGAHAPARLAQRQREGARVLDLRRGVGAVAELVLEPHQPDGVALAVGRPARDEEAGRAPRAPAPASGRRPTSAPSRTTCARPAASPRRPARRGWCWRARPSRPASRSSPCRWWRPPSPPPGAPPGRSAPRAPAAPRRRRAPGRRRAPAPRRRSWSSGSRRRARPGSACRPSPRAPRARPPRPSRRSRGSPPRCRSASAHDRRDGRPPRPAAARRGRRAAAPAGCRLASRPAARISSLPAAAPKAASAAARSPRPGARRGLAQGQVPGPEVEVAALGRLVLDGVRLELGHRTEGGHAAAPADARIIAAGGGVAEGPAAAPPHLQARPPHRRDVFRSPGVIRKSRRCPTPATPLHAATRHPVDCLGADEAPGLKGEAPVGRRPVRTPSAPAEGVGGVRACPALVIVPRLPGWRVYAPAPGGQARRDLSTDKSRGKVALESSHRKESGADRITVISPPKPRPASPAPSPPPSPD